MIGLYNKYIKIKWYIIYHTRDEYFMYVPARSRYGLDRKIEKNYPMVSWSYLIVDEATREEVTLHILSH
jgi:hypothetical protein